MLGFHAESPPRGCWPGREPFCEGAVAAALTFAALLAFLALLTLLDLPALVRLPGPVGLPGRCAPVAVPRGPAAGPSPGCCPSRPCWPSAFASLCVLQRSTQFGDFCRQRVGARGFRLALAFCHGLRGGVAQILLQSIERVGDQTFARRRFTRAPVVDLGGAAIQPIHDVRAFDVADDLAQLAAWSSGLLLRFS